MREHTDGEFPFANDFNAVVRDALAGSTLVESGCDVSDGGTNDLSLDVASGEVVVNGTDASVSSQSVTLASADPDNPRYDLVVADDTGTASVVAGTPSSTPKAPSIPSDSVLLAVVEVPAGASGATDADIYDARAVLSGIPNSVVTQGSGSGLDADTLDGQEASVFEQVVKAKNKTAAGNLQLLGGSPNYLGIDGLQTTSSWGGKGEITNTFDTTVDILTKVRMKAHVTYVNGTIANFHLNASTSNGGTIHITNVKDNYPAESQNITTTIATTLYDVTGAYYEVRNDGFTNTGTWYFTGQVTLTGSDAP